MIQIIRLLCENGQCDSFLIAYYVLQQALKPIKSFTYMMWWSMSNSQSNHFPHILRKITWSPYTVSKDESQTILLRLIGWFSSTVRTSVDNLNVKISVEPHTFIMRTSFDSTILIHVIRVLKLKFFCVKQS